MTGQPFDIRGRYALGPRIGRLLDGGRLWGYLRVRPEAIEWRRMFRRVVEPAIVEETYRLARPAPEDVDWADGLGWSDTIVTADRLEEEVSRLQRNELLVTGRTFSIEWLDDDEAAAVEGRFFSDGGH